MPPKKADADAKAVELDDPTEVVPDGMSTAKTTHSRERRKLCEQVLLDHFGPIVAHIGAAFLERGRLSLNELQRFLDLEAKTKKTTPPPRSQVLHTILILVQHNILWHIRLDTDNSILKDDEPGGTEYFDINPEVILLRSRFGTYLATSERLWGEEGLRIINLILLNGKMEVSDLLSQLPSTSTSTRPLLTQMLLSAYLTVSTALSHISPHDLRQAYIHEETIKFKGVAAPKDKRVFEANVRERIAREREKDRQSGYRPRTAEDRHFSRSAGASSSSSSSKSKANGRFESSSSSSKSRKGRLAIEDDDKGEDDRSRKKAKLSSSSSSKDGKAAVNGSSSHGNDKPPKWMARLTDEEKYKLDGSIVDESVFVRLNYDRFDVHIRNDLLHELIESQYNKEAADVYLRIVEAGDAEKAAEGIAPGLGDSEGGVVSLNTLAAGAGDMTLQLKEGIDHTVLTSLARGGSKLGRYDYICEYVAILSGAEVASSHELGGKTLQAQTSASRYLLPGTGSTSVTTPAGSHISPSCKPDFAAAARKLKWSILKQTVKTVFGDTEAQILGVLRKEGRLEEKQIAKLAMLGNIENRSGCSRLFAASVISLQEIPKSAERKPERTFYLYFLDYPKALNWLTDQLHRTQARLSQRRAAERAKEAALLSKIERTDVQEGGVQNVLAKAELLRLEDCREKLRMLTMAEARVEREAWVLARMKS